MDADNERVWCRAGGHPPGAVIDRRPPHFLVVTKLVLTRSRIIGRENVAVIETSADLIRIWMISAGSLDSLI